MRQADIILSHCALPRVEYLGQRVVTFSMTDAAHQRPEGTARASFNRNRQHFIEGEDYVRVSPDECRTIAACAYVKHTRKKSANKLPKPSRCFLSQVI